MWSYYTIRPISIDAAPRIFYAPDLAGAFDFARRVWGSATLECTRIDHTER